MHHGARYLADPAARAVAPRLEGYLKNLYRSPCRRLEPQATPAPSFKTPSEIDAERQKQFETVSGTGHVDEDQGDARKNLIRLSPAS